MAIWDITVNAGSGVTTAGQSVNTTLTPPGDFDGATIDDVSHIPTVNVTAANGADDTCHVDFYITNTAGTNIYGGPGGGISAAWSQQLNSGNSWSANLVDDTPNPQPSTAVAADWDELRQNVSINVDMKADGLALSWPSFTLRVTYTPAGSTTPQSVAGSSTMTGALKRVTQTKKTGSATMTGSLATVTSFLKSVTGSITAAGAVLKQTALSFAGSSTLAGALAATKVAFKTITGSLTATGAISSISSFLKSVTGSLTMGGGGGTPTLRASNGVYNPGSGGTVHSVSITPAGSNRFGLVQYGNFSGVPSISSVYWGATDITANVIWQRVHDGAGRKQHGLYYIINPPAEATTVTVTLTSGDSVGIQASAWDNVDQATAYATVYATASQVEYGSDPISIGVTPTSGRIVIGHLYTWSAEAVISGGVTASPQTDYSGFLGNYGGGANTGYMSAGYQTSDGSDTFGWDYLPNPAGPTTNRSSIYIIELIGGGGGNSLTLSVLKALSGSMTAAGALIKQAQVKLTGSSTWTGAVSLISSFLKTVTGSATMTGAVAGLKIVLKALSGSMTAAGALIKQAQIKLTGSSTWTGLMSTGQEFLKTITGSLTATGNVIRDISITLAGSAAMTGALSAIKTFLKTITGSLTATGALSAVKTILKTITGSLTATGNAIRDISIILVGSATMTGALSAIKTFLKTVTGAITATGALGAIRTFLKTVTGTITAAGSIVKRAQLQLAGTISAVGDILRRIPKVVSGSITAVGNMTDALTALLSISGAATMAGAISKQAQKVLSGAVSMVGTLKKQVQKLLAGAITATGAIVKQVGKFISGNLSMTGLQQNALLLLETITGSSLWTGIVDGVKLLPPTATAAYNAIRGWLRSNFLNRR